MAFLSRKLLGTGGEFETPAGITRVGTAYSYQLLSTGTTLSLDISGISIQNNDYLYLHTVSTQGTAAGPTSGQGFTSIHTQKVIDTRSHNMNLSYVQLNGTETSIDTEITGTIGDTTHTVHAFAVVYRGVTDPLPISGGTSLLVTASQSNDRDPIANWLWSSSLAANAVQVMFHGHSNYYDAFENWDSTGDAQIGSVINYEENHQDVGGGFGRSGSEMYFLEIQNYGNGLGSSNRATGSNPYTEGRDARVTITFPIT